MNRDVERGAAVHEHAAEQAFDRVSSSQHGGAITQVMDRLGREDLTATRLYAKGQFWLDRYNKLAGNA
jgi:hypothetical protein